MWCFGAWSLCLARTGAIACELLFSRDLKSRGEEGSQNSSGLDIGSADVCFNWK